MKRMLPLALIVAGLAALALLGGWGWRQVQAELAEPFDRHGADFSGSESCRNCHQDRHASWQRTFHRTMTQEASARSVQGAFDGKPVTAWGGTLRPVQKDGAYLFEQLDADGSVAATYPVARTVGSHRYQQYLMHRPDNGHYIRLPLLWHIGDARWVHMNGAFLYDDHQGFHQHTTTWNHNCIYCHNTGPEPRIRNSDALYGRVMRGEPVNFLAEAQYESDVAELGIACESCHGPGAEHARRNRNPLRRVALRHEDTPDPTIVSPRRLDARRATEVCAQCHAQRVPARPELVETWLRTGPTFRAGDVLTQHVRMITPLEPGPLGNPDLYRLRFWNDGTPRLSAYEYQGLAQSKCYDGGQLSCMNCHDAHGGDVHGMMREGARGNAPCAGCHTELARNLSAHTGHAPESSGSRCINCHMPPMVYGVMEIHRSHRIEIPDALRDRAAERPNACAGCHLNKSSEWLATRNPSASSPARSAGEWNVSENTRQLLGGDPVQRAVAAKLAGRADSALGSAQRMTLIPALLLAMDDGYPAVRRFAWKSLQAIAADGGVALGDELARFDFTGPASERGRILAALTRRWRQHAAAHGFAAGLDAATVTALRQQAALSAAINIGE